MKALDKKITLFSLVWPIFLENLFRMLLGNVNVLMLSHYSDQAVGAVGVANQIISMVLTLYTIVSLGTGITISQYLGAKDTASASKAAVCSLMVNTALGFLLSIFLAVFSRSLLRLMNLPEELMGYATQYMWIVGGASFLQALIATMSSIVRSYGITRFSMYIALVMNVINVLGNSIVILKPFGFPELGVVGIAGALIFSEAVGFFLMLYFLLARVRIPLHFKELVPFPKKMFLDILKIGSPAAAESLSWSATQTLSIYVITLLGAEAITTRIYVNNIVFYIYILGMSIGQATQIYTGHLIGAGKVQEAYDTCIRNLKIAIISNAVLSLVFILFRKPLLGIFTQNQELIQLGCLIMLFDWVVETGRAFNHIVPNALRGAGDVRYPVVITIFSMWGISLPLCYLLGIHFHLGLLGIWFAYAADEWFRGLLLYRRWRSKQWQRMSLVTGKPTVVPEKIGAAE